MMFTPDRVLEILVPLSASLFMACLTAYVALLAFREFSATRLARATAGVQQQFFREQVLDLSDRRKREQLKAERTWDGFRKFVIARKVKEAADICSFYFEPHDRKPLPPFSPGQYLTFRLNIPGQPKPVIRCYSLSDSPKAEYFRCTIKRIGPPPNKPDQPPGLSSSFFHDQLEEGDIVDIKAPSGAFFMDPREEFPAVLIGGGIGLTPMVSMLNAITEAGAQRDVYYFYGLRHRDEHVMGDHVRQIAADNPNVQLHVCYSDARAGVDKEGHDYQHGERVSIDLFKRVLPSSQCHYYLCGPPPMMEALVKGLEEWGVPEDHIHFEAFGPASVKKAAPVAAGEAGKYQIAFARSDKKIMWDGKQTLLEVAEANSIRLDFGCRAGNCGTCITAVKEGTVNYPTKPAAAIEAGSCLACVALPASNLIVDG